MIHVHLTVRISFKYSALHLQTSQTFQLLYALHHNVFLVALWPLVKVTWNRFSISFCKRRNHGTIQTFIHGGFLSFFSVLCFFFNKITKVGFSPLNIDQTMFDEYKVHQISLSHQHTTFHPNLLCFCFFFNKITKVGFSPLNIDQTMFDEYKVHQISLSHQHTTFHPNLLCFCFFFNKITKVGFSPLNIDQTMFDEYKVHQISLSHQHTTFQPNLLCFCFFFNKITKVGFSPLNID